MASRSSDVYAHTNPALGALLIWAFSVTYTERQSQGADLALIFLPLPIVLSGSLAKTFEGTNSRTGFLNWVVRNPEITVGFASRLEQTNDFTRESLLFGIQYGLVNLNQNTTVAPVSSFSVPATKLNAFTNTVKIPFQNARRLGLWLGSLGSTVDAFHSLGVTP